jgi:hypothetical protein
VITNVSKKHTASIYKMEILVSVREQYGIKMFLNRALREILEPKEDEVRKSKTVDRCTAIDCLDAVDQ